MSTERAVELLMEEAGRCYQAGRYVESERVAGQAVQAAQQLGLRALELRALRRQADALMMLGDFQAALARYSRLIAAAHDPQLRDVVAREDVTRDVVQAHMSWVTCARFLPQMKKGDLLTVLDQGEAYLDGLGRRAWRAGFRHLRAQVLYSLGRTKEAMRYAEEAVVLQQAAPDAPGYTLDCYRRSLADLLRWAGRSGEARPYYQQVLDNRGGLASDRNAALQGLAWCALDEGHAEAARRHAERAVEEAEPMGHNALCTALEVLASACRAQGDLDAAWQAAERHLASARRTDSLDRLHGAVRDAAELALTRGDTTSAATLLDELMPLAERIDTSTGRRVHTDYAEQLRARLTTLRGAPSS